MRRVVRHGFQGVAGKCRIAKGVAGKCRIALQVSQLRHGALTSGDGGMLTNAVQADSRKRERDGALKTAREQQDHIISSYLIHSSFRLSCTMCI